jgi:hypothetical protein
LPLRIPPNSTYYYCIPYRYLYTVYESTVPVLREVYRKKLDSPPLGPWPYLPIILTYGTGMVNYTTVPCTAGLPYEPWRKAGVPSRFSRTPPARVYSNVILLLYRACRAPPLAPSPVFGGLRWPFSVPGSGFAIVK